MQYPVEILNRQADIFRMAGHMLGQCLLLHLGLVVSPVAPAHQSAFFLLASKPVPEFSLR